MPQELPTCGRILFILQIVLGFITILFASQEVKFAWAGNASSGFLALWAAISIALIRIYGDFLLQHFAPLALWTLAYLFAFSRLLNFELYHVGLFIPLAVNSASISVSILNSPPIQPESSDYAAFRRLIGFNRAPALLPPPAIHPRRV